MLDFPFGLPSELCNALGLRDHDAYLRWCREGVSATDLRDVARAAATRAGHAWSKRRAIDDERGTTWFPLFQQLYRQTLIGARDVLMGLRNAGVAIGPFAGPVDARSRPWVVEGFPGYTIRSRLGLRARGYKNRHEAGRLARQEILDGLVARGIPIPDECRRVALGDVQGDAVDALTLLLAAWQTAHRPSSDWTEIAGAPMLEGWFFD